METAFCGTDAEGAWLWKDAYEALEAAQVLFLRKFGAAMRTRAGSPPAMLEMLTRLAGRLPSQTRRSEESEHFQQFSTPIALGFVAAEAAALTAADLVLEPSAGTGLLAIFAELAKARLALNEIADTRAGLLGRLFRDVAVTRHNAEQIHDRLDPAIRPSVVLMNPPFSASPHVEGRFAEAAIRHLSLGLRAARRRRTPGRDHRPQSSVPISRPGATPSSACRKKAASSSPRRSPARPMPATARPSRRGSRSSTACRPMIRARFRLRPAWPPMPPNCSTGCRVWSRRARRSRDTSPAAVPPCFPARGRRTAESSRAAARARQTPGPSAGFRRARLRDPRVDARRIVAFQPASTKAMRCRRSISPMPAASDQARPVGGHGRGRPSPPLLPAASAAAADHGRHPVGRAARERRSMPAKPMPAISPAPTPSTRPTTSSRPHPPMPRTRSASGAAGFSATAPAPARAARSPRSFSTTGSKAAAGRSGSPNPTN